MEVLITVTVVGLILLAGSVSRKFWLSRYRQRSRKTRQQWASRSPEKLSEAESQFCRLVARGIEPEDAADGVGIIHTRQLSKRWMNKPKIQREIADVKAKDAAKESWMREHPGPCLICRRDGCRGDCQVNIAASDDPTADLTGPGREP